MRETNVAIVNTTARVTTTTAMRRMRILIPLAAVACVCTLATAGASIHATQTQTSHRAAADTPAFHPGARVLLDAHNAYPERGQWADRIERALATGTPLAIEQDLYWAKAPETERLAPVVAHDDDALNGAPTLESYFFDRIRPVMEQALRDNQRAEWPLIVLNLDFKDNNPRHLDAVWELLGRHESWLTTATRTDDPQVLAPLSIGPLMVLSGSDSAQRRRFHDNVPVGATLRVFGAMVPAPVPGLTKPQRTRRAAKMTAAEHIPVAADNFARWVNFPWSVIEEGGQNRAGRWTAADVSRLDAFVTQAHDQGFWIRFYTLDGFTRAQDRGFSAGYNFGSMSAARDRWLATISAGVDFVATDQYAEFSAERDALIGRAERDR